MADNRIEQLEAQAAALREALEEVIKQYALTPYEDCQCRECEAIRQARAALSADAGREMLERVRELEQALDVSTRALDAIQKTVPGLRLE